MFSYCSLVLQNDFDFFFFLARSSMVKTVSAEVFHLVNLLLGDSDNKLEEFHWKGILYEICNT